MDAISPRLFTFSDPGSPKRPSSRASSTGTEVPGVPRSLAREVEHIKSLIIRANLSSSANEGSITATLFRLGARQETISHAHIVQELDGLKRRIKAETRPTPRRQIDNDPETETESEPEDVVDERDEELDSIREELHLVREQREKWIEAAEERVDKLTDEKDSLLAQLESRQQDLKAAQDKLDTLSAKQKKHDTAIAELKSAHAKQFNKLNDTQLKNLERERDSALRNLEDKDNYIESLEQDIKDLTAELHQEQLQAVELDKSRKAAEDDLRREHAQELNYVHRSADLGLSQAKAQAKEQAEQQQQRHEREVSSGTEKHKSALTALLEENEHKLSTLRTTHDAAVADLNSQHDSELRIQEAKAAGELRELRSTHETTLENQLEDHQKKLAAAMAARDSSEVDLARAHDAELATIRAKSASACKDLQAEHDAAIEALRKENEEAMQRATEKHHEKLTKAEQVHMQEADRLRAERELALKSSAEGATSRTADLIADLDKRHDAEREKWQTHHEAMIHKFELAAQGARQEKDTATAEIEARLTSKIQDKDAELEKLQLEHQERLTATQHKHHEEQRNAARLSEESLQAAIESHAADIDEREKAREDMIAVAEQKSRAALEAADKKCDTLRETHATDMHDMRSTHDEESSKLIHKHKEDMQRLKDAHAEALESSSRSHLDTMNDIQLKHHEKILDMQEQISKANTSLAAVNEKHESDQRQLASLKDELASSQTSATEAAKISEERLKHEHEYQLQTLREDNLLNASAAETKHQEMLQRALDDASRSFQAASEEARKLSQARLDETTKKLQTKHAEDLLSLKSDHSWEVVDLKSQLTAAREEADRSQRDHASLSTLHANEIAHLFSDHKAALTKLQAERPNSSGLHPVESEVAAATAKDAQLEETGDEHAGQTNDLQQRLDRLDAEILEQHQARNHLEGMLQQKTHEAIQAMEETKQADRKHAALQLEMKSLQATHERTEHSLRELHQTIVEHETLSTDETTKMQEELQELRTQIDAALQEKAAVQSDIDSKSTERSELSSQNDFLTKQLSELGAQMNGRTEAKYASRGMQTAPRIEVLGSSPKRSSQRRKTSLSVELIKDDPGSNGVSSSPPPSKPKRSSIIFGPELNHSIIGSPLARMSQKVDSRPTTPENPVVSHLNGSPGSRRSLQDYLQKSETPLFEPGSVATANEALLARKIQEHVGDMQMARDTLAKEYQDKFDALLREKKRLDKQVTLDQAADFVKEREVIASRFMANEREEVIAGSTQPSNVQSAEQRLVQKYNRRIAKRKSQIRLQHAEDFQNLTQDYDRRLADLLFQKAELESDLGFGQYGVNGDSDDTVKQSKLAKYVSTDDAASKLPRRNASGISRVSSIPRMASFSKEKEVLQVVKSRAERSPSGEGGTNSRLAHRKTPSEGRSTRSSNTIDSDSPLKPLAPENPDSDYAGDADEFDKHGRSLRRQSGSPNIRTSGDVQRVSSMRINDRRPSSSSEKSKRHSSILMYAKE